jgi:hypothetical protein
MTLLLPHAHSWTPPTSLTREPRPRFHSTTFPMALAATINGFDHHALNLDDRTFMPNHAITWIALRQLPGRPCGFRLEQGGFSAAFAQATLGYGIPSLNFAWNNDQTISPSRLRTVDNHVRHSGLHSLAPDQAQEWAVLRAMRSQWSRAAYSRFFRGFSGSPPLGFRTSMETKIDLLATGSRLPRPFLAYQWCDLPILRQSAYSFRRSMPEHCLHRLPTAVLVDAEVVARLPARLTPIGLWWDLTACERLLRVQLEAFLFPVVDQPASFSRK